MPATEPASGMEDQVQTIAFLCTANICRSPMAHAIFAAEAARRNLSVVILSAGVDDYSGCLADEQARMVCDRGNTPMPKFVSTYAGELDLSVATRVFGMEHRHLERLRTVFGVPEDRLSLMGEFDPQQRGVEIEDPICGDLEAFENCYARLGDCIRHYLETTQDFVAPSSPSSAE